VPSVLSVVKIVVVVCRKSFRVLRVFRGKTAVVVCSKSFRRAASTRFVYQEVQTIFAGQNCGNAPAFVTVRLRKGLIYKTLRPCDI